MYASFPPYAASTGSNAIGLSVVGGVSVARATDGPSLSVTGNGQEGQGKLEGRVCMGLHGGRRGGNRCSTQLHQDAAQLHAAQACRCATPP